VQGLNREQVMGIVLHCKSCGAYNNT
jgi:hypothetical protein